MPARLPTAKFEEVVQYVLDKINSGEWKPGDKIPSQKMWMDAGVKYGTLRQAYLVLKTMGLIVGQQGDGVFVAGATPSTQQHKLTDRFPMPRLVNGRVPVNGGPRPGDESWGI